MIISQPKKLCYNFIIRMSLFRGILFYYDRLPLTVTLIGDEANQAMFESVELLANAKVATKEVQITHRWLQTGRSAYTGEYRDNVKLIVVERKLETREWFSKTWRLK